MGDRVCLKKSTEPKYQFDTNGYCIDYNKESNEFLLLFGNNKGTISNIDDIDEYVKVNITAESFKDVFISIIESISSYNKENKENFLVQCLEMIKKRLEELEEEINAKENE